MFDRLRSRRTKLLLSFWCLLNIALVACITPGCRSGILRASGGSIAHLHLLGTPVAINLDSKPGPDGVGVRLYASHTGGTDAVRILTGTLKLMMFDGSITPATVDSTAPLASYEYTAEDLRKLEHRTAVGFSYNFVPAWGDRRPTAGRVTIVASYQANGRPTVWSQPITVPLGK